jgi:hypothetical protein
MLGATIEGCGETAKAWRKERGGVLVMLNRSRENEEKQGGRREKKDVRYEGCWTRRDEQRGRDEQGARDK